jgi:hypothetical protein
MDKFSIHGKVRSNDNKPAQGFSVHAYDKDTINADDFLGEKDIYPNGFFRAQRHWWPDDFAYEDQHQPRATWWLHHTYLPQ